MLTSSGLSGRSILSLDIDIRPAKLGFVQWIGPENPKLLRLNLCDVAAAPVRSNSAQPATACRDVDRTTRLLMSAVGEAPVAVVS